MAGEASQSSSSGPTATASCRRRKVESAAPPSSAGRSTATATTTRQRPAASASPGDIIFHAFHAVPARVRCGFAAYFSQGTYEDHWVCEYWKPEEERWAQADSQLDERHRTALSVDFDIADLPENWVARFGAARTLARPDIIDMRAGASTPSATMERCRPEIE